VGGGSPTTSRASDFTAVTARNGLGFFFFAILWFAPADERFAAGSTARYAIILLVVPKQHTAKAKGCEWKSAIFLTKKSRGNLTP
jgi:hypothetical protein